MHWRRQKVRYADTLGVSEEQIKQVFETLSVGMSAKCGQRDKPSKQQRLILLCYIFRGDL